MNFKLVFFLKLQKYHFMQQGFLKNFSLDTIIYFLGGGG